MGECGLLVAPPLTGSSRPLGSSLGLLAALGFTSALGTVLMAPLAGGEGGFVLEGGSEEYSLNISQLSCGVHSFLFESNVFVSLEPIAGNDMPGSPAAAAAALGVGGLSTTSCFGGLTQQHAEKNGSALRHHHPTGKLKEVISNSYPSSGSDGGLRVLLVGELKGVPESVSLELSR